MIAGTTPPVSWNHYYRSDWPGPGRHARMLVAWAEGIMFDSIAGAGHQHPPAVADLRATLLEYLHAIVPEGR